MLSARRVARMLAVALAGFAALPQAHAASGDQALAKRVLPRVADYPAGWAADPTSKPSDSGCFTSAANAHAPTARAQASPDFLNQERQERSGANVWIFLSAGKAHAALAAMTAAAPLTCYRKTISSVLTKAGLTVTSFVSGPLALGTLGDAAKGTRLTVGVRKGSDKAQLTIDLIFVQRRRALIAVGFNAQSSQPLLADERTPIARSIARVPA
jgi:hypothetical protein